MEKIKCILNYFYESHKTKIDQGIIKYERVVLQKSDIKNYFHIESDNDCKNKNY